MRTKVKSSLSVTITKELRLLGVHVNDTGLTVSLQSITVQDGEVIRDSFPIQVQIARDTLPPELAAACDLISDYALKIYDDNQTRIDTAVDVGAPSVSIAAVVEAPVDAVPLSPLTPGKG